MRHTILATIMLVALTFSAEAYDFKSGDLCYNITSSTDYTYTVEVTKDNSYSSLSTITIPQIVINENERMLYKVTSIGSNAFANRGLTSVTIPNSVTSIGDYAFSGCSGLTTITIPNSVTSIGSNAFANSGLTSVTFAENSNLTSIGGYAFYYCSGLTTITIPNSVTSIGSNAFANSGLTSVTIPNSVTSIGGYAFSGCSGLTSLTIPNSVTSIGEWAFSDCHNLNYNEYDNALYLGNSDNPYLWLIEAKSTDIASCEINPNCRFIYSNAFKNCSGLTTITIPNSVTSIGSNAFANSGLTSVTIPNSVTSIDGYAFYNCSGLTTITIPNSVTSIGSEAFSGCNNLNYNEYDNALYLGNSDNPYLWLIEAKSTDIASCEINPNCRFINNNAFKNCSDLTSITIPNSVKNIGSNAFSKCSGLTSVNFAENSQLTSIGDYAFEFCSGLTSVIIPNSVISIGDYAFEFCSSLTSVTIPNSVTSIGRRAFNYCSGLTSVTIPNSVKSIGDGAFYRCSSLTSVIIPNSVTNIGSDAFASCRASTLYCQATEKPSGWANDWNPSRRPVVWGYKTVSLSANDNTFGTVSGGGVFSTGSSINITAISAEHYHFAKWNDGNTENPRSITVTSDTTLIAVFAIDTLKVTASAENGTVFGGGVYTYGTSILLGAIPAKHYHFAKWSDGNTENPRSIKVTSDTTLIAVFAIDTLKVNTFAENGTVSGTGAYTYGTQTSLTATPAEHYHFAKWNDGNTENPRSIKVTSDTTLIAVFAIDTFKVTASAENGTVSGAGLYAYGTQTSLTATPAEHYHFAKWNDGNTENPRSIKVTSDTTLIAVFAIDTLKVNTFAENGTVSGAGLYAYGASASLTATPTEHYHFTRWSDGNTENPRSTTVTTDMAFTAMFAIDTLKVTASAENGTVLGAGEYTYGISILLVATPAEHYHFAKWSDGNTENPRSIKVTSDTTLIAVFAIDTLKVTASAENGTVLGAGKFIYGTSALLVATPAEHYHFAKWSDGNIENPRSITVTEDITLIAIFEKADAIDTLKVTASAENGTVFGAGEFAYGTSILLGAIPAEHYHFVKWSDGNTENPRSITVTEDITLIAIFEKADAISTDAVADVKIYAHHNVIVVENATDDIYVYDAMGRLIARNSDSNRNAVHHGSTEITMQNTGIYIVKVGNETKRVYLGF